jgi:capsular exopolysaccharide synthesis family protein
VELREYLRAIRRRWRLIFVMVVLTVGAIAALTMTVAPSYKSSTTLFVSTSTPDSGSDPGSSSRLNSYIALVTGPRIATSVKTQLRLPLTVKQIQKKLSAEIQPGTNLLVVTATDRSATQARNISAAAATRLIAVVKELEPTPVGATTPPVTITVAQEAVTSRAPQNLVRNLGFAAVLGLLLGAGGTALRETLHRVVTSERDLHRYAGLDTVGVIALGNEVGRRRRPRHPDSELAEAFRKLRTRLPFPTGQVRTAIAPVSLLVTSSVPREGSTAIACGLAIALAETGSRVVLVDGNLREPGVGAYLALDATRGLADVLTGTATVDGTLRDWGNGRLHVLPAGFAGMDPGELLASPALAQTIGSLEDRFDIVLIDSPSLLSAADAAVLSKLASGVLLVVRAGRTRTEHVERATAILHGVGARLVGGVLNALPKKLRGGNQWRRVESAPHWRPPEQPTALLAAPVTDAAPPPGPVEPVGPMEQPAPAQMGDAASTARGRARVLPPPIQARGRAQVIIEGETAPDPPAPDPPVSSPPVSSASVSLAPVSSPPGAEAPGASADVADPSAETSYQLYPALRSDLRWDENPEADEPEPAVEPAATAESSAVVEPAAEAVPTAEADAGAGAADDPGDDPGDEMAAGPSGERKAVE